MEKMILHIQNMKCEGCGSRIKEKLSKVNGISNLNVKTSEESISFEYTRPEIIEQVKKVLLKMGYPLVETKNNLTTISKSYISCMIGRAKNSI